MKFPFPRKVNRKQENKHTFYLFILDQSTTTNIQQPKIHTCRTDFWCCMMRCYIYTYQVSNIDHQEIFIIYISPNMQYFKVLKITHFILKVTLHCPFVRNDHFINMSLIHKYNKSMEICENQLFHLLERCWNDIFVVIISLEYQLPST